MDYVPANEFNKLIIAKAADVLSSFENEGMEAAKALWQGLDRLLADKRDALPDEVLDLVLQLEFFFEEHDESDLSELRHALYVAEVAVQK